MTEITRVERFWQQVDRSGPCWEWSGPRMKGKWAYGRFYFEHEQLLAHRFSYELLVEPILDGLFILHSCDNPPCVNPSHLRTGTHEENMADMMAKGRWSPPCIKGSAHGNAVLTESEVRSIRDRYAKGGVTQQALGDEFGVRQTLISQIVLRQAWKHVA